MFRVGLGSYAASLNPLGTDGNTKTTKCNNQLGFKRVGCVQPDIHLINSDFPTILFSLSSFFSCSSQISFIEEALWIILYFLHMVVVWEEGRHIKLSWFWLR